MYFTREAVRETQHRHTTDWGEPWLFGVPDTGEREFFLECGLELREPSAQTSHRQMPIGGLPTATDQTKQYGLGILRQGDTKTKPTNAFRTASGSGTVYQGEAS